MKVFVTGVAGFLGSHIAREGLLRGWEVTGIDSMLGGDESNVPAGVQWAKDDACDVDDYANLVRGADVTYHCAAAPYEGLSVFAPQIVYRNVVMGTVGALRASINAGVGRFINCSSMSRYGGQPAPFTEDMPVRPEDPYACAKVAAEEAVRMLCGLHGMDWVTAVPHNIFGENQRYWDPYRNVAGIMINRVLRDLPPVVYGDGSQRRCLSFIGDVTDPLMTLATAEGVTGEVWNVGPDDEGTTILELAQLIMDLCGMPGEPLFFPPRPAEVHTAHCSAAKARSRLGYVPQVELKDGLQRYIDWIRQHGPRPFEYHMPLEITSDATPRTWSERLM